MLYRSRKITCMLHRFFLPQHSFSTTHLNCRANQPFNIYYVANEANLSPRCPPSMLQDEKRQAEKETRQEAHCKKTSNHVLLYPPPSLRRDKTISCPLSAVRCPCVSNLHYSGAPRCPTCTIGGPPSIVQDLHYWGRCPCPEILPALYRAPALFNLHYIGPSTVLAKI